MKRIAVRLVLVTVLMVAGACGKGGKNDNPAMSGAAPASTSTSATATSAFAGGSTSPVSVPATKQSTALLRDVRAAAQGGADRVVFEFTDTLPGYRVQYIGRPITEDGSGREVEVRGSHFLQVHMENALDADLGKEGAPRTYTGPNRLSPAAGRITELVRTGGFEGVLTWVIGVNSEAPFKVSTLSSPPRLVIEIAHQ